MTERQQLLAAIAAAPGEDTPRLVFADWLDEQESVRVKCPKCEDGKSRRSSTALEKGPTALLSTLIKGREDCSICYGIGTVVDDTNAKWAEWIRVGCELATMMEPWCKTKSRENNCEELGLPKGSWCDWCHLRWDREAELRATLEPMLRRGKKCGRCDGGGQRIGADRPFEYMPNSTEALRCPDCRGIGWLGSLAERAVTDPPSWEIDVEWRRGFPCKITCTLEQYTRRAGWQKCEWCWGTGNEDAQRIVGDPLICRVCGGRGGHPIPWVAKLFAEWPMIEEMVIGPPSSTIWADIFQTGNLGSVITTGEGTFTLGPVSVCCDGMPYRINTSEAISWCLVKWGKEEAAKLKGITA